MQSQTPNAITTVHAGYNQKPSGLFHGGFLLSHYREKNSVQSNVVPYSPIQYQSDLQIILINYLRPCGSDEYVTT
jgi:hypothetical protein